MSTINPLYPDKPNPNLQYCKFELDATNNIWKCSVCNNYVSQKLIGNNPPFAICRKSPASLVSNRRNIFEPPQYGVGTELKKLLSSIGIKATPNCSCNAKARTMDSNGIEWCEKNIDTIVGWLRDEAIKRNLPFIDLAGKILVKKAIRNAKKNGPLS